MSLRARIVTLVSGFLLAVLVFGLSASLYREYVVAERELAFAQSAHAMVAKEIEARETQTLSTEIDGIDWQRIVARIQAGDDRDVIEQELVRSGLKRGDLFELIDRDANILFGVRIGSAKQASIFVSQAAVGRILQDGSLSGLSLTPNDGMLVVAAKKILLNDRPSIVAIGRSADEFLFRFARTIGAPSVLIGLRGRTIAETQVGFSNLVDDLSELRGKPEKISTASDEFAVTKITLRDFLGDPEAIILSFTNITKSEATRFRIRWLVIGLASLTLIGAAIALDFYLWRSFRPLQNAVDAVEALSRGNPDVVIETGRRDEIGRIAAAAALLRIAVMGLARARRQRRRIRNRLEGVINGALSDLSASLDDDGRDHIAALAAKGSQDQGAESELKQTARVLRGLTDRILDQHARMQSMIEELQLAVITKARLAGLEQELEIARHVQASMLPEPLPPNPRFAVHGMMEPAREVGGDFFDFFKIDDRRLGVIVADVSGKGVPAAFFMAITKSLLRAIVLAGARPADAIEHLNAMLADHNNEMMFVTLFYGVLDLDTGAFVYVNAGHNPPLVIRRNGDVHRLPGGDVALAVVDDLNFDEHHLTLAPGESIFLYTDGVTEACDRTQTLLGDERLQAILSSLDLALTPQAICQAVYAAVETFENGADRADDITCVALKYRAGQPAVAAA